MTNEQPTEETGAGTAREEEPASDHGLLVRNRVVGVIGLVAGLAVALHAWAIGFGGWQNPGPGMWPLVVGVLLVLVSVAAIVQRFETLPEERFNRQSLKVAPAIASLFVFVWAFSVAGLVLPGFLLMVLWLRGLGRAPWLTTAIVAAVTTMAFYYLFVVVLGVPFPDDLLLGGR